VSTYTVTLEPVDPKMLLSINAQNRKGHWSRTAATRYWMPLLRHRLPDIPLLNRALVDVDFRFPNNRIRDTGNLYPVAKILVDGIVGLGVLPADDDRHLVGPHLWRDYPNGPHRVTVRIVDLGPKPDWPAP
jgi:hypothetical protein